MALPTPQQRKQATDTTAMLAREATQNATLKMQRTFRVSTFICTGLSGFAPFAHGIRILGLAQMWMQSGIGAYLLKGALLVAGALFYATRVLESLRPGRFDVWGSSHQIFHVFVVLATTVHFVGIVGAYDYNYYHRA